MATKRQLNVVLFGFPYGGNSGVAIEQSTVARWRERIAVEVGRDPRIGAYYSQDLCDTPITMTRNRAVLLARQAGADVLVMVDSDMSPDVHCQIDNYADPKAKPFFQTAFDFLYNHYDRGPVCLMAPYGGKTDHENMFVFRWRNLANDNPDDNLFSLEQWTREECWQAAGIHDVAAGPTGLCMIDMRCFDLLEPASTDDKPWFYYEYTDKYQTQKASTEDVTFTRDLSLVVNDLYGYEPNKCLFDCWAGHNGFRVTRKPKLMTSRDVAVKFRRASERPALEDGQTIDLKNHVAPVPKPQTSQADRVGLRKTAQLLSQWQARGRLSALEELRMTGALHTEADMAALASLCGTASRYDRLEAVEVGSFIGESARVIANAAQGECVLTCVDTWGGSPNDASGKIADEIGGDRLFAAFRENCADEIERGTIKPLRMDSLAASALFPNGTIDLAFIDANHDYEAVKADIEAWLPKVRDGGILCGHDYGPMAQAAGKEMFPGVRRAVDEAFGREVRHHIGTSIWSIVVEHRVTEDAPQDNPPAVNHHEGNGEAVLAGVGTLEIDPATRVDFQHEND